VDADLEHGREIAENTTGTSTPPSVCLTSDPTDSSNEDAPDSVSGLTPPSSPPPMLPAVGSEVEGKANIPVERDALAKIERRATNAPRKRLVQMQLNLGQPFQKRCKTCSMEYVPSNTEDAALHNRFHARIVDGVHVGRDFVKRAESWGGIEWHGKDGLDRIVCVTRDQRCRSGRQHVMSVLDVAQKELGAVDIPYNLLWSRCHTDLTCSSCTEAQGAGAQADPDRACRDRYKVYLYIHGTKCVGLCLVERIHEAHKVLAIAQAGHDLEGPEEKKAWRSSMKESRNSNSGQEEPIAVSEDADDARMGVSRIWVSFSFRNKGVATALLDCASKTFCKKQTTRKELIAFSQPTQSGARLARRWFGKSHDWHVYRDCNIIMELEHDDWISRRGDEMERQ